MKKMIALVNNDKNIAKMEMEKGYITYRTLADRVGNMILCNNMSSRLFDTMEFESGTTTRYFDDDGNELTEEEAEMNGYSTENEIDIFQYYIISDMGAEYLKYHSKEIVFYDGELDVYVWGITHYGTSWDYVFTDIKATENIEDLLEV